MAKWRQQSTDSRRELTVPSEIAISIVCYLTWGLIYWGFIEALFCLPREFYIRLNDKLHAG
ncbi:hypothetical protein NGUA15_01978 [Salmonella enterica]|nr:hypothetical protein NGUA15_01978 [Salmonella enterica]